MSKTSGMRGTPLADISLSVALKHPPTDVTIVLVYKYQET